MDFIVDLLKTRGAQLIARYGATGLVALGTKLSVTVDPTNANATAETVAAFIVAGILALVDHFSHAKQAEVK